LEQLEKTIIEKEIMARDQYGYKIPYYGYPKTYADKIKILEQRLNALIDFLKAKGVIDKAYVQKDAKETVLDSIREELNKQEWSKHVSKEYFEEQVRLEGIRRSLSSPHKSTVLEQTYLSEGISLDEFIENGWKEKTCPFCKVHFGDTWSREEFTEHLSRVHTDQYTKWMHYITMIIKMKESKPKGSIPTSEHPEMPQPEPIPDFKRDDFKPYIKDFNKEFHSLSKKDQEKLKKKALKHWLESKKSQ
jgi:hypothetical protein